VRQEQTWPTPRTQNYGSPLPPGRSRSYEKPKTAELPPQTQRDWYAAKEAVMRRSLVILSILMGSTLGLVRSAAGAMT
jgi:hypothetical protein